MSRSEGERVKDAQIGAYDEVAGGQPENWWPLKDKKFLAGGMIYDQPDFELGSGPVLYTYALAGKSMDPYVDLSELGIDRIEGLALGSDDLLYVIDGQDQERVVITGWRP